MARGCRCTPCGRGGTARSSTARRTWCGAAAAYSADGLAQTRAQIAFYMENARLLREGLGAAGFTIFGGVHAPYLWLRTRDGASSWAFFDRLLSEVQIVGTPG